jgi:HD-GYP domain-containing protein (c-di-GMP phosphodiesterase class II)
MEKLNIRYQNWFMATIVALVLVVATVFLFTVHRTFNQLAEESAAGRFTLIGQQADAKLETLVLQSGRFVTAQSRVGLDHFAMGGRINTLDMVQTFLGSLEADPTLYSHYFGLANDEFLQVIAIREDLRIMAALKAPEGSYFAVRRIENLVGGERGERWEFLDRDRKGIDSRNQTTEYRPTSRSWYSGAMERAGLIVAAPYVFASSGELGVTVATPLPGKAGVIGTDILLQSLNQFLLQVRLSPNGAIALQDPQGRILAFQGSGQRFGGQNFAALTPAEKIDNPYLAVLKDTQGITESRIVALGEGDKYIVSQYRSEPIAGSPFRVTVLAPVSDFSGGFEQARNNVMIASLFVLLLTLPLAFLGSRRDARTLANLARDSERIKRLDFSGEPSKPETFLYEVKALADAQAVMQTSIRQRTTQLELAQQKLAMLVENGLLFSSEKDRSKLLRHILFGGKNIVPCQAATLFLKTEHNTLVFAMRTSDDPLPTNEIPLYHSDTGHPNERFVAPYVAIHNKTVVIDDVYGETRFDLSGTKRFSEESGFRSVSMLTVPLSPQEGEVIGVLQLLNATDPATGAVIPFAPEIAGYVEGLAAQAAVALQNQNLVEAQRVLMDALIKIIAGSIDAKSPYTGGHCERVPELALMLAEEACKVDQGPLADFRFTTDDEWREFRIGAWLHDCGKVTTPEYVVDKATKLETIYNRIHEVRTRFEVLLRDAEIDRLTAIYHRNVPSAEADARFAERKAQLLDDFAFIAECNIGGEFMAPEKVERMKRIAAEHWQRNFDDRLGLSHEELLRYVNEPASPLPATETLLADKPHHVVPRIPNAALDEKYGWKVKIPENLYNFGEVYNLAVARGTLSEEERFKINEHIIQTIVMLDRLPLPKQLRRIPEYAGTHHETMIGTGYPRKLTAEELSIPARIMAIADIFEALTASDRPYKKGKTLSESVKILSFFKKDRHIDPVLFDLFLSSGIYKRYAERYLKPEQLDEVDITPYLG